MQLSDVLGTTHTMVSNKLQARSQDEIFSEAKKEKEVLTPVASICCQSCEGPPVMASASERKKNFLTCRCSQVSFSVCLAQNSAA